MVKNNYPGTIRQYLKAHKGTPILSDVQLAALEGVAQHPGIVTEDQSEELVRVNQDILDVYRSFIPGNLVRDYVNWLLAHTVATKVRRARRIAAARNLCPEASEIGKLGAVARWRKWREAVAKGLIVPRATKPQKGRNGDVVLITPDAHKVYVQCAPKLARRLYVSDFIIAEVEKHVERVDHNRNEDLVKQAYINRDAHKRLKWFVSKYGGTMGGTLSAFLILNKLRLTGMK